MYRSGIQIYLRYKGEQPFSGAQKVGGAKGGCYPKSLMLVPQKLRDEIGRIITRLPPEQRDIKIAHYDL